ncbi:hypothetical protein RF11_07416 [Thelohanellus kitauei]|uniref:E3 ubiquitin-protein ligase n=1 Tax=Thelohanellus kitauei TaxID=669202 RepID=A0A0C2IVZ2_THEKT|nr:hypothetical protein RF11_07416 [Thelohanellus kitauei]
MLIPNIFDELLSEILFELKRKSDIGEGIIDNICEGITDNIFEGIIDNIYYYYNGYSAIFNFSRKYFVHLLLLGVTNNKLSPEIVAQVVGNEKIVMYIAQPFMQLLCLRFRCDTNEWHPNMAFDKFTDFYNNSDCVPFLNQQILLILQMMASSLDPEKFLKYMLVGIFHFLCEQGNDESLTSIRLKLKFSPCANQHYSLIMIFNILYERPYTGLQEDWKSIMVERRLIHFLAIEDKTHQEILKDISVRFAMDNIEEDFLNQILKRVSFKTSHDTVEKFSLKDKYFGVINPFFYMYNSSESREALRKLDNLYQQRRCVFRLMEIPELISEFEEMNYFIFSKVFFEMITFWMEQGFACFAPRHNVRENLILVLMCISLILKLSKYPEVAGRYESLISYIFRKHECFFHQTIFQVLKKISSEILDPMTHSIIDYILELKGGSTAYKRISFTQELKRSQNPTMHDTKKRCELPWDTSEESDDNQIEHAKQAIPTRDFTVFCEGCGKCESFRFGKFNIYQYSSSHLCFALIRWSRKTNDCETAEVKFSGDVVLNNSGLFEAIDNFDKAIGQRPTMTVSGCSHFIHLTCTNIFKETLNQTVDRLGSNTILNCPLCNRKNNFRIPVNFPIHKEVNSDVSLNRISNFLKIFVELDSAESSSHGEEYTRDTKSPLDSRVKCLLNEPTSWTNYDLKNCAIIYHMEGNSPDISAKHFCSRIISRSISCMVATITRIEKQYRHRYPSFPPTHDPHFNTAAQFSRYCYYTSGLAPALYKSDISESKISELLSPIYFSRLHMLRMLIHTTDPDRTSSKGFDSTSNIDRFEEFVSSYMAISALMSLNPNYKLPFGDKIELSLVRLFYFLVVFDVFVSFRPTLDPRDTDIEIEFSQSEVDGLYEFYVKMKSCASLDQKNKRLLYQSYVYNILPFLRKTAILFFQLYEMESPIMSMSSPNIKFEINSYSEFISLMNHFSLYDDSKTYMSQSELWIKNRFEK